MARKPDNILDELLVLNVQAGNQKAMATLVKRYHMVLISYAHRRTNNREIAPDIVQDAWKVAFSKIRSLHDPAGFRSWIYRIVHNKSVDWVRAQSKERAIKNELSRSDIDTNSDNPQLEKMSQALKLLTKEQRVLIDLYYRDDFSVSEISETLRIPKGTVKSRLFAARTTLKQEIEKLK